MMKQKEVFTYSVILKGLSTPLDKNQIFLQRFRYM